MVSYSPNAAKAIGFLKKPYNDIEIYVEDTASLSMWTRILSKIVPAGINFRSVNMLAGRDNVVKACRLDQSNDNRKRIYIIDGDFDFLLGKRKPPLKRLYRIRAYCIENLIARERNVVEVAFDCETNQDRNAVSMKLNYGGTISSHEKALKALFSVYATAFSLNNRIGTISYNVRNLITNGVNQIDFDRKKILDRCRDIIKELRKTISIKEIRDRRIEISQRASKLPIEMIVSGKDYLLPVIHMNLARKFSYRNNAQQLKAQLSREFTAGCEPFLARALAKAAA